MPADPPLHHPSHPLFPLRFSDFDFNLEQLPSVFNSSGCIAYVSTGDREEIQWSREFLFQANQNRCFIEVSFPSKPKQVCYRGFFSMQIKTGVLQRLLFHANQNRCVFEASFSSKPEQVFREVSFPGRPKQVCYGSFFSSKPKQVFSKQINVGACLAYHAVCRHFLVSYGLHGMCELCISLCYTFVLQIAFDSVQASQAGDISDPQILLHSNRVCAGVGELEPAISLS